MKSGPAAEAARMNSARRWTGRERTYPSTISGRCQLLARRANAGGIDGGQILRLMLSGFQGFLDDSLEIRPFLRRPLTFTDAAAELDNDVDAGVERSIEAREPAHRIEQLEKQPRAD